MDAFIPFISIPPYLNPNSTPQLHALTLKLPLPSTSKTHLHNSLIRLYSKSNSLHHALLLFHQIPPSTRDVFTYATIISAAVSSHRHRLALSIFHSMSPLLPNLATLLCVLKSCSKLGALSTGRKAHRLATRLGLSRNPNLITALIDMYSKSGRLDLAEQLFDRMLQKDLWSWTAMIGGFAAHGKCKQAVDLFYKMDEFGLTPNERTFTAVLSACKNSGWVNEGSKIFNSMHKFEVKASIQHYGCMVDLLVRAGSLEEAEDFVRTMHADDVKPDSMMWRNLIWGCKLHGDYERAKRLIVETDNKELDSGSGDMCILKENVRAFETRVRKLVSMKKVEKLRGSSVVEIEGVVHEFGAGDSKHGMSELIYEKLEEMNERLRTEGYRPVVDEVMIDGDVVEKCLRVGCHSEKLALAFGLICGGGREEILIVKNLRACKDCHSWMKYASRIYGRSVVVRDRVRFHRFSSGSCSCGDYW